MPESKKETVGGRIMGLRKSRRMSAVDLAAAVGVSRNYIHMIEAGKRDGTAEVLGEIASQLETTLDYLLGNTPEPSQPATPAYPVPKPDLNAFVAQFNQVPSGVRYTLANAFSAILSIFSGSEGQDVEADLTALHWLWSHLAPEQRQHYLADIRRAVERYEAGRGPSQPGNDADPQQASG